LERLGTAQLLIDFFSTGKLSSPSSIPVCNDEEYIAACIGWAQELSRYSSMRAIEGDISSVEIVRSALTELHQLLLNFDFRNGQLRRRYDGMKYFVKSVEDTTYELSLLPECTSSNVFHDTLNSVGASASITASAATDNATSENATAESSGTIWNYVDGEAFSAIQQRMAAYDAQREQVMKESRDVQKWSKQAVFSILRGQSPDARQKLSKASKSIERLFVIINRFPALRPGAFGNSLEEWCEAQMLLDWCERKVIPDIAELPHQLNASEYIGGLSDFTGELGRLAVMMAAKREVEAVKEIMEVDSLIYDCISRVNNLGGNFNKKLEAVQSNMKKVEDLVLEMSILERTGRVKKRMRIGEDSSSAPGPGNSLHEV
jgi:predicted translin family RNA/ssDNA-binding protein